MFSKTRATGFLFVALSVLPFLTGCAFIPTPVRLMNKPHLAEKQPPSGTKLCIIVRDERPKAIQNSNMCGIVRNLYMMPTSFNFLAHREHLDQIVAHHLKANLEHLGYTVVRSYPEPPGELSSQAMKAHEFDQEAQRAAWWKDAKSQYDRESKKPNLAGSVEGLDEPAASAWAHEIDTLGAQAVVEVRIRKFWSDMGWGIDVGGTFAWMSANLAVCDPSDSSRRVVFGRKVRGFGHGRGLSAIEAYGIPINAAYWFVLHEVEKTAATPAFRQAIAELAAAPVVTR